MLYEALQWCKLVLVFGSKRVTAYEAHSPNVIGRYGGHSIEDVVLRTAGGVIVGTGHYRPTGTIPVLYESADDLSGMELPLLNVVISKVASDRPDVVCCNHGHTIEEVAILTYEWGWGFGPCRPIPVPNRRVAMCAPHPGIPRCLYAT